MTGRRAALDRRYRKLLRAYPAGYRATRGEEILGTYLDTAGAGRGWPSAADARDVVAGGVRQHLRARHATGLIDGLPVAAGLALGAAAVLAAVWLCLVEFRPVWPGFVTVPFGPFNSLGAVAWLGWLAAGAAGVARPGPAARRAVLAALAATVAVVPAAALSPFDRPPLLVLVPQVALGVLALGVPGRSGRRGWRAVPAAVGMAVAAVVAAAVVAAVAVAAAGWVGPGGVFAYRLVGGPVLAAGAATVAVGSIAAAYGLERRGAGRRGWWAVLLLLPPFTLLVVEPLARAAANVVGVPNPQWGFLAGVAVGGTVLAGAGLPVAIVTGARYVRRPPSAG